MPAWLIYARLAAANRAIEALLSGWAILWGALVLLYHWSGDWSLGWLLASRADDWRPAVALVAFGTVHMAAINVTAAHWLPAALRAMAMAGMAATFAHLSYVAGGVSEAMACAGYAAACLGGVRVAAIEARYSGEVARG